MSMIDIKTMVEASITITDLSMAPPEFIDRYNQLKNQGYTSDTAFNRTNFEYQCQLGVSLSTGKPYSTIAWGTVPIGLVVGGLGGGIMTFPSGWGVYPGAIAGGTAAYGLTYAGLTIPTEIMTKHISEKLGEKFYPLTGTFSDDNVDYTDLLNPLLKDLNIPVSSIEGLFHQAEGTPAVRVDPLLIDLDGDGIETTTVENGVYFDHSNDGFAESSAWVGSDDGMLVTDTNTNGIIDNGTELVLALNSYDTNSDSVIDANDTNFANLKILKGDGTLQTLTDAGIASINLAQTTTNITDENENTQLWTGSYTKTDSTTQTYGDYDFLVNNAYSIATDWVEVGELEKLAA